MSINSVEKEGLKRIDFFFCCTVYPSMPSKETIVTSLVGRFAYCDISYYAATEEFTNFVGSGPINNSQLRQSY